MSKKSFEDFVRKILSNEVPLSEIEAVRGDRAGIVRVGAKYGFDFTAVELDSYLAEIERTNAELDDAELDAASGGTQAVSPSAVRAGDLLLHGWQSSGVGADLSPWTVTHGGKWSRN